MKPYERRLGRPRIKEQGKDEQRPFSLLLTGEERRMLDEIVGAKGYQSCGEAIREWIYSTTTEINKEQGDDDKNN